MKLYVYGELTEEECCKPGGKPTSIVVDNDGYMESLDDALTDQMATAIVDRFNFFEETQIKDFAALRCLLIACGELLLTPPDQQHEIIRKMKSYYRELFK